MLSPDDRAQLLDALRPPQGYSLTRAIATTYSLDLLSLLTAPLAFTFFDAEDAEGIPSRDPVALLHAIRSHAEHLHVFCQQGRIAVPARHQPLFQQLEGSIVEVRAPGGRGVFHPKLWVLRFASHDAPVRYRVLVSSRNLTFDRSWDVLLTLEGAAQPGRHVAGNMPLAEFVAALPKLAARPVSVDLRRAVALVVRELRTVSFEKPPGCDRFIFHPIGHRPEARWPFPANADRALVISPFVNTGCLKRLGQMTDRLSLIGRSEELSALPPSVLKEAEAVWSLRPELDLLEDEVDDTTDGASAPPTGLHAKVFSLERGMEASLFVGSANATTAAFDRNVEFLVELRGARRDFGHDAVLGDQRTGLRSLLQEFKADERDEVDEDQRRAEEALEDIRDQIAQLGLVARCAPDGDAFSVKLVCSAQGLLRPKVEAAVTCRPITLPEETGTRPFELERAETAQFQLTAPALTSFFAFTVKVKVRRVSAAQSFVLNLPLQGEPPDRAAELLRRLLENREQALALLLMMLSGENLVADGLSERLGRGGAAAEAFGFGGDVTLFEALVRALDREPERLRGLERTIRELKTGAAGEDLLPEGFDEVWGPIWAAHQELHG